MVYAGNLSVILVNDLNRNCTTLSFYFPNEGHGLF